MKYRYLFLLLICILSTSLTAQNTIISTDPDDPSNSERPEMLNHFDWRTSTFSVYHPNEYGSNGNPLTMTNPFYTIDEYLGHLNYYNFSFADRIPDNLDFKPEDGWELIHKGNGYALNEVDFLATEENRIGPYFILYNRYTGTLRTFAAFDNIGANDVMLTIIELKASSPQNPNLEYSGLLARYEDVINPLDEETEVPKVVQGSNATIGGKFFSADFKVNYDPCTCNNTSYLNFKFKTKNTGNIQLNGRLIGTNVPLDGSGNSPLLNGRDFLNAVYMDGFDVKGGMLTYNNIDKLVELYETPETPLFQELAIASLKAIMKGAAKPLDKIFDKVASKFLTQKIGGTEILGITLDDTLKVGFGAIGAATKQLSTKLFSEDKIPNIGFIEAEMSLSGEVRHEISLGSGDVEIALPGSFGTENPLITPNRYYPAYNEVLGLFSVLEKPVVLRDHNVVATPRGGGPNGGGFEYDIDSYYQFSPSDFKFYFNPAAEVNIDKTRIYAALVIKIDNPNSNLLSVNHLNEIQSEGTIKTYITDFYPVESLQKLIPHFYTNSTTPDIVDINLRLQIFYEFLPNKYGKVNHYYEILTYPMEVVSVTDLINAGSLTELPNTATVSGTHYASNTTIRAVDEIIVNGNVTTAPGVTVEFISGDKITLNPGANLSPNMILKTGLPNVYGDEKLSPVSANYVENFCSSSGAYLANNLSPALRTASWSDLSNETLNSEKGKYLNMFPNPVEDGNLQMKFYLEEGNLTKIDILNLQGQVVHTVLNERLDEGNYELQIELPTLAGGIYILKLETSYKIETQKLIIKD
ncbi:T9SS type A sorting domain-containing protein [Fulvivirgaceae bacterium BMA12]|uniref:T9SS type A sorting domain-containing protein n=1 Tax=Agaribacillus aureus TaxID=3051825 RepID=A0ABT8LAH6_9BACT|nr:T9SS type A sorting domain-containing protein [Fulvivirgaceae bacterium BMA12]